jgi:hypothetical protein
VKPWEKKTNKSTPSLQGLFINCPNAPTGQNLKAQGKRTRAALGYAHEETNCPEGARSEPASHQCEFAARAKLSSNQTQTRVARRSRKNLNATNAPTGQNRKAQGKRTRATLGNGHEETNCPEGARSESLIQ